MPGNAKYPEMKDSRIPWIGSVPFSWSIVRAKSILKNVTEKGHPDAEVLSLYRDYGIVPKQSRDDNHNVTSLDTSTYKYVEPGNLVLNKMKTWQGSLAVSEYAGIVSPAYYVCKFVNDSVNKRYIHYLLRTRQYAQEFERLSTGMRIGQWDLGIDDFLSIPILLPSLSEQQAIAEYLDTECHSIDMVIEEAKASIEEYKAWKASIIYEAVTKGLDPSVEMKESEVKWLGTVPQHWTVSRLKTVVTRVESGVSVNASQSAASEGIIGVLKTNSVSKYAFDPTENKEVNSDELNRVACPVQANTIIVSRMNTPELVGACGYVEKDYPLLYLPDRLWQVHFVDSVSVKYIYYYLCSNYIKNYYASLSSGTSSSMQNISQGQFLNAAVLLPERVEQEAIVEFLDKKCVDIDAIIPEKESLISDLESYKKTLIFEVVTGKRRVC